MQSGLELAHQNNSVVEATAIHGPNPNRNNDSKRRFGGGGGAGVVSSAVCLGLVLVLVVAAAVSLSTTITLTNKTSDQHLRHNTQQQLRHPSNDDERFLTRNNVNPYWDPELSLAGTSLTTSGNGYDTVSITPGKEPEPLCWRGQATRYHVPVSSTTINSTDPFQDFLMLGKTRLIPDCGSSQHLRVLSPRSVVEKGGSGDILTTGETYNFSVQFSIDLSLLIPPGDRLEKRRLWTSNDTDTSPSNDIIHTSSSSSSSSSSPTERVVASVKIILCNVRTTGLCTPFIHDQETMRGHLQLQLEPNNPRQMTGELHGDTHIDSPPTYVTLPTSNSSSASSDHHRLALRANNLTIPVTVQHPGEYVAIAALQMYTQEYPNNPTIYYRWDMANVAQIDNGNRLFRVNDPPTILTVSKTVEIVSYIAIGLASTTLGLLLMATIGCRNSQVLKLTQGKFLIAFLTCALVAVSFSFLLNPKSDDYCRYSYPILLISLQVMYAITAGRLWRIHAILSPILKHRDSDSDNHLRSNESNPRSRARRKRLLGSNLLLQRVLESLNRTISKCQSSSQPKQSGLKRTIPGWHLCVVVGICSLPQVLIQIALLVLQPRSLTIQWTEDGTVGRTQCAAASEGGINLLALSLVVYVIFLFFLLAVAFCCRNLPSVGVLNETRHIYQSTLTTMILLMLAIGIVLMTNKNPSASPNIEYVVWVTSILWTTLNSTLRIMYPKLKMALSGETVIVSALVQEHHRKIRAKEEAKLKELTAKAHAFQKAVQPLVADHTLNTEFVPKSFIAEEAIDALLEQKVVNSRWEGIQLGRLLERDLGLFRLAGGSHMERFHDGVVLYRFQDFGGGDATGAGGGGGSSTLIPLFSTKQQLNASITNASHRRRSSQTPGGGEMDDASNFAVEMLSREELKQLAEGFKVYVDVRDRKYHMRIYPMCFVASEAIDSMMYAGLAKSREEAVRLGLRFQNELRLFRHVTNDHLFCDEYLFFCYQSTGAIPEMEELVGENQAMSGDEENQAMSADEMDDSLNLEALVAAQSSTSLPRQPAGGDMSANGSFSSSVWKGPSSSRRARKVWKEAQEFISIVPVKDRKYYMRTWKKVFVGAEAVDAMVFAGMAGSRWEAVQLGRSLARDLGLFKHVTGDHAFCDDFLFYRYSNNKVPKEMMWDDSTQVYDTISLDGSEATRSSSDGGSSQLAVKLESFKRCADVRDRRYHGVKYKSCFVAQEVVDNLVFTGVVQTRQEAVKLGRTLSRELRVFHHVTNDHVFSDDYLFFRFRDKTDLQASFGSMLGDNTEDIGASSSIDDEKGHEELVAKAKAFRACAEVRDRKYRFRTYQNCFVGMDTVDMMISLGLANDRKEAVLLGRQLARELNLFKHVCDDHDFCDEYLFFQFTDNPGDEQPMDEESFRLENNHDAWMVNNGTLETIAEIDSGNLSQVLSNRSSTTSHRSSSNPSSGSLRLEELHQLQMHIKNSTQRLLSISSSLSDEQRASALRLLEDLESFRLVNSKNSNGPLADQNELSISSNHSLDKPLIDKANETESVVMHNSKPPDFLDRRDDSSHNSLEQALIDEAQ